MIKKLLFIMLIALMVLSTSVQAQTITMSAPDATSIKDLIVYYPNQTMQGFYNTTSVITLDSSTDYIFTLKPQNDSIIDNPSSWLTGIAFPFVKTHFVALICIFAVAGFLVFRRR